jgi:hypothetical protein
MQAVVIDVFKSQIGALLLFDLNRLSVAPTLVTEKATPLLGQRTSTQSLLWLKEKAAMQW